MASTVPRTVISLDGGLSCLSRRRRSSRSHRNAVDFSGIPGRVAFHRAQHVWSHGRRKARRASSLRKTTAGCWPGVTYGSVVATSNGRRSRMTLQFVYGATVVVFAFGVVSVGPAYAQRRDGSLLPQEQSGEVTAVGCLVRGADVRGGKSDKYSLARPKKGPIASVPEAACTADPGADALTLDNTSKAGVNDSMLGRWVEVTGRLERETSKNPDDLRELDVATFKMVPVVPPPPAATPPSAPRPAPTAAAPRPPPPVVEPRPAPPAAAAPAAPPKTLPKTASYAPAIGLAGLLSLAAGLVLRSFRLRQRG